MRTEIIEELEETELWVEHLPFAFINSGNIKTESHRAGVYIYTAVKIESLWCKMTPSIPHVPTITRHSTAYVPVSSYLTTSRQPQAQVFISFVRTNVYNCRKSQQQRWSSYSSKRAQETRSRHLKVWRKSKGQLKIH